MLMYMTCQKNNKLHKLKCIYKNIYLYRRDSPLFSLSWAHPRFGNVIAVSSFDGEISIYKE